ncbi:MAG TPA: hypothetical protein VFA04_18820 [Bryobacteraceae bacterium]|nr:hypothetical protein [Bryobacteraceae bacterium]
MKRVGLCAASVPFACAISARTIAFDTTRVSAASIALAPDERTLVFTLLGHLFRLPATGGAAQQLTFGPYYDSEPGFSPDGARVAFTSDRDGSEGNIFVLTLEDGEIVQLTHDAHAGAPVWSPDGRSIAYLRYESWTHQAPTPSVVVRASVNDHQCEPITAPAKRITSLFYLPGGRLAWSVLEGDDSAFVTRIEAIDAQGSVSTVRTIPGSISRVRASSDGAGLYCDRTTHGSWFIETAEDLLFVPMTGPERQVTPVTALPPFAVSTSAKHIYMGQTGRLWSVLLPSGVGQPLPLRAREA